MDDTNTIDLYSILACPNCKVSVQRQDDRLVCSKCGQAYPIVNGVPVLLPDASVPITQYQHQLHVRPVYDPWVHRVVMQSLPSSARVLDLGAGNLSLDLPNVIRMDVTLTPYVDVVGDAHALPFLPGTMDFIFSLAVIEHLRQPFVAAQEMFNALRNGGYAYGECNFVFAYHGYPHHYFNASQQGLEQVFAEFEQMRCSIAPYQMPSEAIRMVLLTYLASMTPNDATDVRAYRALLEDVLDQRLGDFDAYFTEESALNVAAGVFFFGRKTQEGSTDVVPQVVQSTWEAQPEIQTRFPRLFDLGVVPNVMLWAKEEGRRQYPAIDAYFRDLVPFHKKATVDEEAQAHFAALPANNPAYHTIPDRRPREGSAEAGARPSGLAQTVAERNAYIEQLEAYIGEKIAYMKNLEATVRQRDAQVRSLQARINKAPSVRLLRTVKALKRKG